MNKKKIGKGIVILIGVGTLGVLALSTSFRSFMNESIGEERVILEKESYIVLPEKEITDMDYTIKHQDVTKINLEELTEDLLIEEPGNYLITGEASCLKIKVDVSDDEIVCLILRDVDMSALDGPAINILDASKVIITVEGTNILKDDASYQGEEAACVYSNADITINGNGELYVYGYNHDGIRSKDRVKIVNSTLWVQAKNNGIRGNDGVYLKDSVVDIQSEGIGIKTDSNKDYVIIQGGSCNMISGENAIVSECQVLIENCQWNAYAIQDKIKCNGGVRIEE